MVGMTQLIGLKAEGGQCVHVRCFVYLDKTFMTNEKFSC